MTKALTIKKLLRVFVHRNKCIRQASNLICTRFKNNQESFNVDNLKLKALRLDKRFHALDEKL